MTPVRSLAISLGTFLSLSMAPHPAGATTRTVTTLADSGAGSLRDTMAASGNGDTVIFSISGTIALTSDFIRIPKNITVNGPGPASLTIDASGLGADAIAMKVSNGTTSGPSVTIYGLRLTTGGKGAGLLNDHAGTTLNNCEISGNEIGINNDGFAAGSAAMTINNCLITGNEDGIDNEGGSDGDAELNLANSTIYLNSGTGITNFSTPGNGLASVILNSCTMAYNGTGVSQGANITASPGSTYYVTSGNTIFAQTAAGQKPNFGTDGTVVLTSNGFNLFSDNPGMSGNATDQYGTDPKFDLAGLVDNGGPTRTLALSSDSPAIDKGNSSGLSSDQRGQVRPIDLSAYANVAGGDGSDIGAFESADPIQAGNSLTVNTSADHDDGVCGVSDCTLREAIAQANRLTGPQTITLNFGGTITLTSELGVTDSIVLVGPGARTLAISGNQLHRVFNFSAGTNTISGLTIRDGAALGVIGSGRGGGIYNAATLSVIDCILSNNLTTGYVGTQPGEPGGFARGGAISNDGSLTLSRCTFSGNGTTGGKGAASSIQGKSGGSGGAAQGGAIFNNTSANATMTNCTISGNSATGGNGGNETNGGTGGNGGDAFGSVFNQGTLTMTACTVSGNTGSGGTGGTGPGGNGSAGSGRGGLTASAGTATLRSSLSAGNGVSDAFGTFASSGYNLIGVNIGAETSFPAGSPNANKDIVGNSGSPINALLGLLQNNGGATDTMLLSAGSPAIDQGISSTTTDQRGFTRPLDQPSVANASGGDGADIGAVEVDIAQSGSTLVVNTTADHSDGLCGSADCTLREAISAANSLPGDNTITFASGLTGTIQMIGAFSNLATNIVLNGPGANLLTVRGTGGGSVFIVGNGTTSGPTVSIQGLAITNGNGSGGYGGGVKDDHSTLTLSGCALTFNQADSGGGGVFNDAGALTVVNCTFNNNSAGFGGGLYSRAIASGAVATATVENCTFFNNTATDSGSTGYGGGLLNLAASSGSATLTVLNCTLSLNSARLPSLGGGIHNRQVNPATAALSLGSTILQRAGNSPNLVNDTGTMTSQGYNISNDTSAGLTQSTDRTNLDPRIESLAMNGGPIQTCALLTGSPAIDQGKNLAGLTADQRAAPFPRTVDNPLLANAAGGDGTDIGAYEYWPLRITAISRMANGSIRVQGVGAPLQTHHLQTSSVPDGSGFTNLKTAVADSSGVLQYDDSGAIGLTYRFYRLAFP